MCRLVAGLLVCLTVCLSCCSPAMAASTTPSQIMAASVDDSGLMVFSNDDYSVQFAPLTYDINSDVSTIGTYVTLSGAVSDGNSSVNFTPALSAYNGVSPYIGFAVKVSGTFPVGSYQVTLNNLQSVFHFVGDSINGYASVPLSSVVPFRVYARGHWSGTGKFTPDNGAAPSFVSLNRSGNLDVSYALSDIFYPWFGSVYGGSFSGYNAADYNFSVTVDLPKTVDEYEVVSGSYTDFTIYYIYKLDASQFQVIYSDGSIPMFSPLNDYYPNWRSFQYSMWTRFIYDYGADIVRITSWGRNEESSAQNMLFAGVQQSISTMSQNLTKQVSELKSTIQQGANEVKNEIKSQTQTITDKLTAVKDDIVGGITDLKETTTQGFKDVVQGITDLPGKIGEMLQGLIVPDSEKVSGKFEEFNGLAEEKLGVIYQVPEMVISMGQSVVSGAVEQKGEMTLPKFEIIMPATNQSRAGERLTVWEEYTFPIWPEGTEVIHTAVQTATSLVCVIAMINSIKRKYEEWLDGH